MPRSLLVVMSLLALSCAHRRAAAPTRSMERRYDVPPPPPMPPVNQAVRPPPESTRAYSVTPPPPPPVSVPASTTAPTHRVSYGEAARENAAAAARLQELRVLEFARDTASYYRLPRPLMFAAADCDGLAAYSPRSGVLSLCFGLVPFVEAHVPAASVNATLFFIVLHELGHLLIAELALPVLGRSEPAADQFAAVAMMDVKTEALLGPVLFFDALSKRTVQDKWDEHTLDAQRSGDLLCLLIGGDTSWADSKLGRMVPSERRVRCPGEFAQAKAGWAKLLGPHQARQ